MFICSVRASTVRFFAVLLLCLLAVIGVMVVGATPVVASAEAGTSVSFDGMRTNADRVAFLQAAGLQVREEPVEEESFVMPEDFDRVLMGYNELQRRQGLDLSRYARKKVTRYTYEVTNEKEYAGTVYANLLIYRNRIIGCDVSSADPEGFVRPILELRG